MIPVIRRSATVGELHSVDPFADRETPLGEPEVWLCEPTDSAVVLGSRQSRSLVDIDACRRAGLGVVRRRSGGGMVLIRPSAVVWIDLVLPHGVVPDDVRESMIEVGRWWCRALERRSTPGVSIHTGPMVVGEWSELVCFAGLGPGEVLADGRKFVGLSQRRTRQGLRVQGMLYRRSVGAETMTVLADPPGGEPPEWPHHDRTVDGESLARALAGEIDRRTVDGGGRRG